MILDPEVGQYLDIWSVSVPVFYEVLTYFPPSPKTERRLTSEYLVVSFNLEQVPHPP